MFCKDTSSIFYNLKAALLSRFQPIGNNLVVRHGLLLMEAEADLSCSGHLLAPSTGR